MIKFNWIRIEAYKAIADTTIHFTPGVTRVTGKNLDDPYDSNGAGKSTILQALVFVLFNRDFNGAPINSLGNRSLNREPTVTLNFTDTVNNKTYTVENDRRNKSYRLICEDQVLTSGALETQKAVQQILGMTYNTFKLTHFITGATINSIAEDLSQPVIFNDLLQVSEYQQLEKDIAEVIKELQLELKDITDKLSGLQKSQELLSVTSKFNVDDLEAKLEATNIELAILTKEFNDVNTKIASDIEKVNSEIAEIKAEVNTNSKTLVAGICQHCGTTLTDAGTLATIRIKVDSLNQVLLYAQDKHTELTRQLTLGNMKYRAESKTLEDQINSHNVELSVAKEVERITELHNSGKLVDNSKVIDELTTRLSKMREVIAYLTEARKEVKSGNIIKDVLDTFFLIVETRMVQYATLLNLTAFQVKLKPNSFGMRIAINQTVKGKEIEVPIETLSNGEKTRLSLLILVSMLDAMKVVSNCETNYLVFDEASSSFDKSGVQELSLLFNHLKTLGQSCFIITHGSEMDSVPFDSELVMTKLDGKSSGTINVL